MAFRVIGMGAVPGDDRARAANEAAREHVETCHQCGLASAVLRHLPPEASLEGLEAVAAAFCPVGGALLDELGRLAAELSVHAIEVDD